MEHFNSIFQPWPQYRVIYCRTCRFCPVPSQLGNHLDTHHHHVPKQIRQRIVQAARDLAEVAWSPEDVIYPEPESSAVVGLPVCENAHRCLGFDDVGRSCQYVVPTLKKIQEHCRKIHGWVNEQKRGGNVHLKEQQTPNRLWLEGQKCQQFFRTGAGWKRCFAIEHVNESERLRQDSDGILAWGQDQFDQHTAAVQTQQAARLVEVDHHPYRANPWLERAAWPHHLAQYAPQELVDFIAAPSNAAVVDQHGQPAAAMADQDSHRPASDDGVMLWLACETTARVIKRAQKTCHPNITGLSALELINRRETGTNSNERPFYGRQVAQTMKRYIQHYLRILCYLWRSSHQPESPPPYRMTPRQQGCFDDFRAAVQQLRSNRGPTQRQTADDWCLSFWIALLDHPLKDHQHESPLVSGSAVLGWDGTHGIWRHSTRYTMILSGIITVARMLVIAEAHRLRQRAIVRHQERGYTEDDARQKARSLYDFVQEMVGRFMTLTDYGGHPSPMSHFFHLRTYGMTINMNETKAGMISWHGDEIQYGRIRFSMAKLRSMVHGLVASCRQRLLRELLMIEPSAEEAVLPQLDLSDIYDDPSETRDGWSFLQDSRNQFPVDGRRWLLDRVITDPRLQHRFIEQADAAAEGAALPRWRLGAIQRLFSEVVRYKKDLLVLFKMCGGGTPRGSEIITVQHRNSSTSNGRGIFVTDGMLHFVTGYHKRYSYTARPKIVHRFLPEEIGKLVVYYFWLVQPLVELLQGYRDQQYEFGPWIWEPKSLDFGEDGDDDGYDDDDDDDTADHVKLAPEAEMAQGSSSRAHASIQADHLSVFDEMLSAATTEDTGNADHPHGNAPSPNEPPSTIRALNVDGFWTSSRVRYTMQRATRVGMGVAVHILAWRHIVKHIIREYSRDPDVQALVDDEKALAMTAENDVHHKQFAHSGRTGGGVYGRALMEAPHHTVQERDQFRRLSVEWHRFLGFASARRNDGLGYFGNKKGSSIAAAPEIRHRQLRRWQELRCANLRQALRDITRQDNAEFRGVQEQALAAIGRRDSPIVLVMGTGTGKSMMFLLPAAFSRIGLTVVVVPLDALRSQVVDWCRSSGIHGVAWDPEHPADGAQVVVVTPEGSASDDFHSFLNRQQALGLLDRIVVDECHVMLESTAAWRHQVLALANLSEHETQLIYLTATLPPVDEARFFRLAGLLPHQVVLIRDTTTRPNIQYRVGRFEAERLEETIAALVAEKRQEYPLPGQIVIYCRSVQETKSLGELLDCTAYYRAAGDAAHKRELLARLMLGHEQVFTATSALGMGIDRGSIRVVIHIGVPRSIAQFAQESGRAGRDGRASESIILRPGQRDARGRWRPCSTHDVEHQMQSFVDGSQCRRVILDSVMDGRHDRISCEGDEERCGVCIRLARSKRSRALSTDNAETLPGQPHSTRRRISRECSSSVSTREPVLESQALQQWVSKQARLEQRRADAEEVHKTEQFLDQWHRRCPLCAIRGLQDIEHDLEDCLQPERIPIVEQRRQIQRQIRFGRWAMCWDCGLPQEVCGRWERQPNGGFQRLASTPCPYEAYAHVDLITVALFYGDPTWPSLIHEQVMESEGSHLRTVLEHETSELEWWGQKIRFGGSETSQLMRIYHRCARLMEAVIPTSS